VDDSASVRTLLGQKLRAAGYDVEEFPDGASAAERAIAVPPSVVVTDLMMPGMSGVQLCRLLHADAATASVPVILLTAAGDRRSRFWARSAGAVGYVTKTEVDALVEMLPNVLRASTTAPPAPATVTSRGVVQERLSQLLDSALFDAVIAGEVRSIAGAGDEQRLFTDFAAIASEVLSYRWLALVTGTTERSLSLHVHEAQKADAEQQARLALGVALDRPAFVIADDRALGGAGPPPFLVPIFFGTEKLGDIALGFGGRGIAREDKKLATLLACELAGPLRMTALIEETRRLAATDALTGLLNRRAFLDAAERERARATRHALPVSLLLVDVDHFKEVNDTRGHAAGDAVLRGVAKVVLSFARKSDLVARWGGEEFVVALAQTNEAGARIAAERLRRSIADSSHPSSGGKSVKVTASIGIASAEAPWTVEELLARADQAMYAAKGRGRNRVEVARA
jgi:two-component system cell cycle response regulator